MEETKHHKPRTLSSTTVDRAFVESIFTGNGTSMQSSPMEHIGSPKASKFENANEPVDPNEVPMSPAFSKPSRSRPSSIISTRNKSNRLSLSFPIQLPTNYQTNTSSGNDPTPETTMGSLIQSPVINSSDEPPNDFLQELARQERRVLELREELGKAEGELEGLKKKWAFREAQKKRSELRANERMVPYSPKTTSAGEESDTSEVRRSTEMTMDRRKALLLAGIGRESRRKVLEGRHTRTLSLLSPDRSNFSPNSPFSPFVPQSATLPHHNIIQQEEIPSTINGCVPINMGISRSATLPDNLFKPRNRHSYHNTPNNGVNANEVLKTGKKLAQDFRAGLWTFVEDLRQATVGEEGVNGSSLRTKSSSSTGILNTNTQYAGGAGYGALNSLATSTPKKVTKARDKSPIVERDYTLDLHELIPSIPSQAPSKRRSITAVNEDLRDDDWLNWDSPAASSTTSKTSDDQLEESQRWSSSTFATDRDIDSPSRGAGNLNQEGIQWPALKPFSPFHLKKTAESLMREWEKSLTPPPEREEEEGCDGVEGQTPMGVGDPVEFEGHEHHDLLR